MEVNSTRLILVGLGGLLITILFLSSVVSRRVSPGTDGDRNAIKVPRVVPYTFPVLKSTFPFLFDGFHFFSNASQFSRGQASVRIALLKDDLYLVHGVKNVAEVFRNSSLSVALNYGIALKHCFGMAQIAVDMYIADTSGSHSKPLMGSNVQPQNRVSHLTHESLLKGLLGTGLAPTSDRFGTALTESLNSSSIGDEWVDFPELLDFFENHIGTAVIKAIFGSALLSQDPDFVRDLWAYDKAVMSLAKRLPSFWNLKAYGLRDKLLLSIKSWHAFASSHSRKEKQIPGDDADPFWGSGMIRDRYKMLLGVQNQDYDSVASTDLGLIWATVTNVVPSSMTLVLHVLRDSSLLSEIRRCLAKTIEPGTCLKFNMKLLEKQPLLLSMYAETLRFGVQIHIPRSSPHQDANIGGLLIPRDKIILINTWLAHTDEAIWNTKSDTFPLNHFWAQRFLIDPTDPSSGPTKRELKACEKRKIGINGAIEPYFSTEGLESAWIPFGGGHHACPGRVLAKRIMLLSCANIASRFDIEILAAEKALEFGSQRFGFGVRRPMGPIPFRIRRRRGIASDTAL